MRKYFVITAYAGPHSNRGSGKSNSGEGNNQAGVESLNGV